MTTPGIFPNGFLDTVASGIAAKLPTTPCVPSSGTAFTHYFATDTGVLYVWNPATSAWQVASSAPAVTLTAARTLKAYSATYMLSAVAGFAVTLPIATGSGISIDVGIETTLTSGAYKVLAGQSTDYLTGNVCGSTVSTKAVLGFSAAVASTFCSLQLPFTGSHPSGGFEGDWFELTDVGANRWLVAGMYQSGTTPTTPFNTATS